MKNYIGVKMIKAKPCTRGEYAVLMGRLIDTENTENDGYLVEYEDGYKSWSPKSVFDKFYFRLEEDSKITENDVTRFMGEVTSQKVDSKTTLVRCESLTGFVQYETSSCVDPKNYDENLGKMYGTKNLVSKYWHNLGFLLQWAKNGLNQ